MVFNATFNNISVISRRSVLLVEETWVPGINHPLVASHWQTLSHNVLSSTPRHEREFELTTSVVIGTNCTGSCRSNYHTITTTAVPLWVVVPAIVWYLVLTSTIAISALNTTSSFEFYSCLWRLVFDTNTYMIKIVSNL